MTFPLGDSPPLWLIPREDIERAARTQGTTGFGFTHDLDKGWKYTGATFPMEVSDDETAQGA